MQSSRNQAWYDTIERNRLLHGYSPGMQKLFDLTEGYMDWAEQKAREGRSVVFTMGLWQPLIFACDAVSVPYTTIWTGDVFHDVEIAEERFRIPPETCSMVKASLGDWYIRRNGPIRKIFGMGASCEPYNMALEVLKDHGYDIFVMDSAYRAPDVSEERQRHLREFFKKQVLGYQRFLSEGKPLDKNRLSEEIRRRNLSIRKYRRILELRLSHPFYIKSFGVMCLQDGLNSCFGRPDEFDKLLDELIDELERDPVSQHDLDRVIPLVWGGGWGQNSGILEVLDSSDAAILGVVSATSKEYREDIDPVDSLVSYTFDGQTAGAAVFQQDAIERHVQASGAEGIIIYGFSGCSLETVSHELNKTYFQSIGIPTIILEGTFQPDQSTGQTSTRVKAFVEMLEYRRRHTWAH